MLTAGVRGRGPLIARLANPSMNVDLNDFVAGGYFLARLSDRPNLYGAWA